MITITPRPTTGTITMVSMDLEISAAHQMKQSMKKIRRRHRDKDGEKILDQYSRKVLHPLQLQQQHRNRQNWTMI